MNLKHDNLGGIFLVVKVTQLIEVHDIIFCLRSLLGGR